MGDWVRIVGWSVVSALKSQRDLTLENLALRRQLMVLQRQSGRLRLKDRDRLLWIRIGNPRTLRGPEAAGEG